MVVECVTFLRDHAWQAAWERAAKSQDLFNDSSLHDRVNNVALYDDACDLPDTEGTLPFRK